MTEILSHLLLNVHTYCWSSSCCRRSLNTASVIPISYGRYKEILWTKLPIYIAAATMNLETELKAAASAGWVIGNSVRSELFLIANNWNGVVADSGRAKYALQIGIVVL